MKHHGRSDQVQLPTAIPNRRGNTTRIPHVLEQWDAASARVVLPGVVGVRNLCTLFGDTPTRSFGRPSPDDLRAAINFLRKRRNVRLPSLIRGQLTRRTCSISCS
jgi:hypothetical protein